MNREELRKLSLDEKKKLFNYLISDFISQIADPDPAIASPAKHTFLSYVMFFSNVEKLLRAGTASAMTTLQALAAKLERNL
jgi:hypothetical protein